MSEPGGSPAAGWRLLFFRRALARRCPQCGAGRLYRGYARLHDRCSECGLIYRREQGAQTGSMYATAAVTQIFAALLIALAWLFTDWSVGPFLAVSVPLLLAFCGWVLPVSQSFWVGVEYVTAVMNGEDWARPRGADGGAA